MMKRLTQLRATTTAVRKFWYGILHENHGQDMIEYALMAAAVAVASAAVIPSATASISTVFSKIGSVLWASSSS
jgi:Flp pilus assembly pilin Flp